MPAREEGAANRGRAIVFGAGGQIGREAVRALALAGYDTQGLDRNDCDVTDSNVVDAALTGFGEGDVVVNAAAYNDVVRAEEDYAAAMLANGCAPYFIARAASRRDSTVVHFGTDYVFDGEKRSPYLESDAVNPVNAYGRTKLCGEVVTAATAPRHYVVRVSTVFGVGPRNNFVERVIAAARTGGLLRLMGEGAISPTYAADAADIVAEILRADAPYGTYHASNCGACSWFDFAEAIGRECGVAPRAIKLDAIETDTRVCRPLYSALGSEKLLSLGITAMPWLDGLRRYLKSTGRGGA